MTTCSNDQIVALYESSDGTLSLEELHEAFNGEIHMVALKAALMNGSAMFRAKQKEQGGELFNKNDEELAQLALRSLVQSADSDAVRYRSACRILDERKGRLDRQVANTLNFSVTLINQELQIAEEQIRKAKGQVIDVDPRHAHLKNIE